MRTVVLGAVAAVAVLILAGCGGDDAATDPAALEGVEWTLAGTSATDVDVSVAGITATFDGKLVAGFSGVNQYGGPYTAKDDGSLEIGEIASTLMAGPEPLMKIEGAYLELLKGCDGFRVEGDTLILLTGDTKSLTYEKAAEVALPGTSWKVNNYNNGKGGVTTLVEGSQLTLVFGDDGTVSGSAGVNTFNGPYTVDGDAIEIGPLATTKMAGDPELMEQEQAYLKALEASTQWNLTRGTLELRDADGAAMAFADEVE
jgi:heat shock protein HslJ